MQKQAGLAKKVALLAKKLARPASKSCKAREKICEGCCELAHLSLILAVINCNYLQWT